ncbi:hypothetical protein K2173_014023 [Erythroxylum novogranatense]|uniref:Pentatricopeptide repeat-containing protein n=1 Tax=Erythroxylum novogranatense TaxID=1862640 RepID=A0AAV8SDJ0_9ROSI|nr:hypothetical protein K2173_014023 [Erythroxylum novogranatense]
MAHKIKLLYSLRQSLFLATSSSVTRQLLHGKFDPVKRWLKEFESSIHKGSPNFACKLNIINQCTRNAHLSGSQLGLGCWLGVSFVSGCTSISSPVAHSMDGYDVLVDDRDYSDGEDNSHTLWLFIRKFWLPFFFLVTTFSELRHPSLLIANAVFILFSTKPNPLSVFAFVEKLCKRLMRREPHLYLFKSLYANRVDVKDYKLLCLAIVEIRDQKMAEITLARRVFDEMEERDVVSWTAILDIHVEMGDLLEAITIFDEMPERTEVAWSAMIARYGQSGYPEELLELFRRMVEEGVRPNVFCFSFVLSALASMKAMGTGMSIHGHLIKTGMGKDISYHISLIELYSKCGEIKDARVVFDLILQKNVVSWNAMISGYSLNGKIEEAQKLFSIMPARNNVSWSTMIAYYLDHKEFEKVFEVCNEMLLLGESPNKSTFSSLLCACASIPSLEKGKGLHGKAVKLGFQLDVFVGTALIDMYAKAEDIESSKLIFNSMPKKNEISWTAMLQGLAESGFVEESLKLFQEMERSPSVSPNELMLLSVLFACSHSGLVDKGLEYFNSMETVYGIKPKARHYTCVVDMLCRAGHLSEAEDFIESMPFQPETNAWATLLSGCKTYKKEVLAEKVANKLSKMVEKNSAAFVLLSNIYASSGRWKDVVNVRKLMKEKNLKKSGGCSWVELRNQVHSFYSEDGSHSQSADICDILELLRFEMRPFQRFTD